MYNYKLQLSYDGTNYNGWQFQKNTKKTIQEHLENTIFQITNEKVGIISSGRTDKGVHAINQVVNFKLKQELDIDIFLNKVSSILNNDIAINNMNLVDERFHSRYNVKNKTYVYQILNCKNKDPFKRKYYYHFPHKLNVNKMLKASKLLIGEKDFKAFSSIKNNKKNTIKKIYNIEILEKNNVLLLKFTGNGFLYNQIRIMVGTLLEIGTGNMDIDNIEKIFSTNQRLFAGRTIPPHGLFLENVNY